jgi:short-chain fatty acids transporter
MSQNVITRSRSRFQEDTILNQMIQWLVEFFLRWIPDSFVIALLLTLVTFLLAILVGGQTPAESLASWGDGLWHLLSFTNQITLTLLLGYAVANTNGMHSLLVRSGRIVRSPTSAYVTVCWITGACALISWGLALVASGIVTRAVGEHCYHRNIPVHYPLLAASSFSGFVVWHQGLSSSIGLTVATPGHFLEDQMGVLSMSETLFTAWNGGVILTILLTLPFVMSRLHPGPGQTIEPISPDLIATKTPDSSEPVSEAPTTPADRLEDSRILNWIIIGLGLSFIYHHFVTRGNGLTLNIFNLSFLMLGMALAGSAIRYIRIVVEGGRIAVPFLIQYPFYAGIAGLMSGSGLAAMLIAQFVSFSTPATLPLFGFLSAGILNMFVTSGGGQWALQGPIMTSAALELGANLPRTTMSVVFGDQWTNIIHPLTLVPIVMIAQVSLRKIMAYCLVAVVYTGAIFAAALLLPIGEQ